MENHQQKLVCRAATRTPLRENVSVNAFIASFDCKLRGRESLLQRMQYGRYRHADTIGEMVHVSALERLGKTVQTDERAHRYEPKNLIQILPVIKATYSDGDHPLTRPDIRVVGWAGEIFKPESLSHQTLVQQTIAEALERLQ